MAGEHVRKRFEQAVRLVRHDEAVEFRSLLRAHPDLVNMRDAEGRCLVHVAAEHGSLAALSALLEEGAVWHALDGEGSSAGEIAFAAEDQSIFEALVVHAAAKEREKRKRSVTQETVGHSIQMGAPNSGQDDDQRPPCKKPRSSETAGDVRAAANLAVEHASYLTQRLRYEDGKLLDADGRGVMMGWEAPLMAKHAEVLLPSPGADVLNIGFGLGLVDKYLQHLQPRSHTIVEVHPDVVREMCRSGWMSRDAVHVRVGRWQDVVRELPPHSLDAIFFDTWEEGYADMRSLFAELPRVLRPGGRFSFFNGFASYNIFYHAVYCRMVQEDLSEFGFDCAFLPVEVGPLRETAWHGVLKRYWQFETYYLPVATRRPAEKANEVNGWRLWPLVPVRVTDRIGDEDSGEDGDEHGDECRSAP